MIRSSIPGCAGRARGFTLVELLVALFAMALLSAMAWQGLESVLKAREASRGAVEQAGRLATVLTQWEQDRRRWSTPALPRRCSSTARPCA